ncbi:hypothetical protein CEXT_370381 [Caerostris extrusa]|uniref:Uncharacterized protein n=1 Tax=Caerostris extrusa TaxID=172846 RepID=A0AAV4NDI4_CAEEX|nr:hypothetical protein CEXT_370381 [Caerostris extrusa]
MLFPSRSSEQEWRRRQKKCSSYQFDVTIRKSRAKMSFVGRCYSLEEAAIRNGDDDRRNVHHISLRLQSGRSGRRCHLLGDVILLKKQRTGMETTTEEKCSSRRRFGVTIKKSRAKMSFDGRCYSLEEAAFVGSKKQETTDEKKCSSYHFDGTIRKSRAKMSFVAICYSVEEAAGSRNEADDRRNVHHISLMLQSGRAG